MTDYKTTIPGTVHNKQLLIIDTGETTDTTSFNGRLVEEFEQSFHQVGTNGTPLLSKFKVYSRVIDEINSAKIVR